MLEVDLRQAARTSFFAGTQSSSAGFCAKPRCSAMSPRPALRPALSSGDCLSVWVPDQVAHVWHGLPAVRPLCLASAHAAGAHLGAGRGV